MNEFINAIEQKILNEKDSLGNPTERSVKLNKVLNVSYASLQALKKTYAKNSDKAGVTDLASKDLEIMTQAFMEASGIKLGKEELSGVEMVTSKMLFCEGIIWCVKVDSLPLFSDNYWFSEFNE